MNRWIGVLGVLSGIVWVANGEKSSAPTVNPTTVEFKKTITPEGCLRVEFNLPSASMGREIRTAMVLPPGFEEEGSKTYPFLYMLHGMNSPYDTWVNMPPLRKILKGHPMVLVTFDGDPASYYLDATAKKDSQLETFFFNELSPFVEQAFRGNGQRAITGFSMGGFGAFHYMLCRPDYFVSVSSLSGALYRRSDYNKNMDQFKHILGTYEKNACAYEMLDINARLIELLQNGTKPPPLFFTCGANDSLLGINRRFRDTLAEQNQKIIDRLTPEVANIPDAKIRRKTLRKLIAENQVNYLYEEAPGGHNFLYWNAASERVGLFHWKQFQVSAQ